MFIINIQKKDLVMYGSKYIAALKEEKTRLAAIINPMFRVDYPSVGAARVVICRFSPQQI